MAGDDTNFFHIPEILLGLLAVGLLVAPLWLPTLPLNEPTDEYERAEIVINDTTIEYASEFDDEIRAGPISHDIACTGHPRFRDIRTCAFEQHLNNNNTVPTGIYGAYPGPDDGGLGSRTDYRYIQLEDGVYKPITVGNTSVQRSADSSATDALYRSDLGLQQVPAERALNGVARDLNDVPSVVADAARSGRATSRAEITVPEDPVSVGDRYYRVYRRGQTAPMFWEAPLETILRYGAPFVGLVGLIRLSDRVRLSYVDKN